MSYQLRILESRSSITDKTLVSVNMRREGGGHETFLQNTMPIENDRVSETRLALGSEIFRVKYIIKDKQQSTPVKTIFDKPVFTKPIPAKPAPTKPIPDEPIADELISEDESIPEEEPIP